MTRLIDADALDRAMYHKSFEVDDGRNVWNSGLWIRYKIYEEASREAPTVDAVPVIRCKDCMYKPMQHEEDDETIIEFSEDSKCPCRCEDPWYNWMPEDDWFCGNAKRRKEE